MPHMKAPYASTINSLTGHCLVAEAGDVLWVPDVVVPEAMAIGWQKVDEASVAVEAPEQLSDNVTETEESSDDVDEFQVALDQALTQIIIRNDESDFYTQGTTTKVRIASVIALMDPDFKKPTATEVADAYERLQDNISLAD